ncbi:thiamine pyrophosphate-dependent enzyme, partial [Bacteroidota bacterium]
YQVISFVRNSPVFSYLQEEDVMSPGTSACRGCPAELAMRFTLGILGKNTVLFTAPGCAISFVLGFDNQAHVRIANYTCLLTNVASSMTGVYRYFRRKGKETNLVAFVGDGATVDIGFQALSGAAERGENFIYICNDNEGYMNTGVQRSGSTPFGARTTTTPVGPARHGKEQAAKYLPLLMLFHGIPYVATATIAYPEDYARKLTKAMQVKDGLAYIHLLLPCTTGWGIAENKGLDAAKLAVETNYFPLWEAEHGKVRLTKEIAIPRPIEDYTSVIGRYSHLQTNELESIQHMVNERYRVLNTLACHL